MSEVKIYRVRGTQFYHDPGFDLMTTQKVVLARDSAALEAECDSLWSTYVALVDKLGIDTEKAKTADGKPSDVIVSYVDALRAENAELRELSQSCYLEIAELRAENERLRKALEHCLEVMKDPWKHGDGCISRAIYMADAALAASTGQEMEKQ